MSTDTSVDIDLESLFDLKVPCIVQDCEAEATHFIRLTARVCGHELKATLCEPHLLHAIRHFSIANLWTCTCGSTAQPGWINYWRL